MQARCSHREGRDQGGGDLRSHQQGGLCKYLTQLRRRETQRPQQSAARRCGKIFNWVPKQKLKHKNCKMRKETQESKTILLFLPPIFVST